MATDVALVAQEDSVAETIRKVGLEKLLSIGEIIDKYYGDLEEAFNEEIANTLPEHRPHDCKIELEPDASLYKGCIRQSTLQALGKKKLSKNILMKIWLRVSSEDPNLLQDIQYYLFQRNLANSNFVWTIGS